MTIKLNINNQPVELTLEEAKALHKQLSTLFPVENPHVWPNPYTPVPFPITLPERPLDDSGKIWRERPIEVRD